MGSAAQMREKSGFDRIALANDFVAVYAQGTNIGGDRHAWNTGYLLRRQVREADDIAYFDALIDRLVADHGVDPSRVYMTGGSNGGMMTFVYAVKRAERLAAAAPIVASMFSFDVTPTCPLPMLIINGAKDKEVPIEGGMSDNTIVRMAQSAPFKPVREVVDYWVKANKSGSVATVKTSGFITTTTYAATKEGAVTEFVVDEQGGHGWPGTPSRRGENQPISFQGAERVWRFFSEQPVRVTKSNDAESDVEVFDFPDLTDDCRDRMTPSATAKVEPRRVPIKLHVPAQGGPYPVIVVSHGAGGDRDSHYAQAKRLASDGYAVFCVEHVGSNRDKMSQGVRPLANLDAMVRDANEVFARPQDIGFAIDRAAEWNKNHPQLKGRFDVDRVGVMGHSYGAFTTMVVCGMRPALNWLEPRVKPGEGLGPDFRDPRVKCGVALSPQGVGEPFFIEESFGSLAAPMLGVSGTKDSQIGGKSAASRKDAFSLWPRGEHQFVWIANANHLDFTDSTGTDRRMISSPTRADVQPLLLAAILGHFDTHLRSSSESTKPVSKLSLEQHLRGEINAVEVIKK
jgi:poly(3-hydroxybutyrate) depolymerase